MAVLLLIRPFFRRTIFHFHAGGLGGFADSLPAPFRPVFRRAYHRPDAAVRVSAFAPDDGAALKASDCIVIPNGIRDRVADRSNVQEQDYFRPPTILFVGLLGERKGTDDLLAACGRLRDMGFGFRLRLVGAFESQEEEKRLRQQATQLAIESEVEFNGVLTGDEKWAAYEEADIFCYPTHHETETFGLSAVEAMSFGLPVVATSWRGLIEIVEDGITGYLVPIRDDSCIADRLADLLSDPDLRRSMGVAGRARFLERFSLERFHHSFQILFREQVEKLHGLP